MTSARKRTSSVENSLKLEAMKNKQPYLISLKHVGML